MDKNTIKNICKSIFVSAAVVPAMGILVHFMPGKGTFLLDDAKLSHRFETAYNIHSNPAHRGYTSYGAVRTGTYGYYGEGGVCKPVTFDGTVLDNARIEQGVDYDMVYSSEKYAGTPGVIYPLHVLTAMAAFAYLRRREKDSATR